MEPDAKDLGVILDEDEDDFAKGEQENSDEDQFLDKDEDDFAEGEQENSDEEQDPVAEGETLPALDVEPSFERANSLSFFEMCSRLEIVWKVTRGRSKNKKLTLDKTKKLQTVLPVKLLDFLSAPPKPGCQHESAFPLIRLLIPDKDSSRYYNMKESAILWAYAGAFQLSKRPGGPYEMLANYREPSIVADSKAVGDFALVLKKVLKERIVHDKSEKSGSGWTVGDINEFLDDLANLKHKSIAAKASAQQSGSNTKTLKDLRVELFRRLNKPGSKGGAPLSPLEHCWLVRIIQQDMRYGIGWRHVLEWFNEHAAALYDAHTSLKAICKTICNPNFTGTGGKEIPENDGKVTTYILKSNVTLTFGRPFKPMLSARTSFERCLDDISRRHRSFIESLPGEHPLRQSLVFQNPAFTVETKLDGERMIIHASRDGNIKIHSRVGNWYSDLYSPVLGPALRRALSGKKIDVVLDGEILAYDAVRKETIPFGQNRTVANLRRNWMKRSGLIDERDTLRDDGDKHDNIITTNHVANRAHSSPDLEVAGEECWLQFVAFDILYLEGPDASTILEETVSPHIQPRPAPGSITGLDGIERKRLLYRVLNEQENEVHIVTTWVIRPDGRSVPGSKYFCFNDPLVEFGYRMSDLDSLSWTIGQDKTTISNLELERHHRLSDINVSEIRASSINEIYDVMVEDQRMEGLVFKDLACPYYLGEESKGLAYWHKFKPDYHGGSTASDLDLVIIGAYFASGLRFGGQPSSFLCACVDSEDSEVFFPLCKVNAGSMRREVLDDLFVSTGFVKNVETGKYDSGQKWFKRNDRCVPDFVSTRTYQPGVESGWKVRKMDYPDLWIHPSDSRIITLNAGEIVPSDFFSAGITLRFPRVTALRSLSEKNVSEVENEYQLWTIYQETLASRSAVQTGVNLSSPSIRVSGTPVVPCRFLTEEQLNESKKKRPKPRAKTKAQKVTVADCVEDIESDRLAGRTIVVLEGTYFLDENFVYDEAMDLGWLEAARKVKSSADLQIFIKKHSGTVRIAPDGTSLVVGGRKDDARVAAHVHAINNARLEVDGWKGKKPKTKRADLVELLAKQEGVLRWTYLFSLVYGTRSPEPKFLDYLALASPVGESTCTPVLRITTEEIQSAKYLERVLAALSESKDRKSELRAWQDQSREHLDSNERWIVASRYQTLWPYSRSGTESKRSLVFYLPPVQGILSDQEVLHVTPSSQFGNMYDSVIPLIRVMGARASSDLTAEITHVLCDLVEEGEVQFTSTLDPSIFSDLEMGQILIDRLKHFVQQHANFDVRLISPDTVRKRKWCDVS